MKLIKYLPFLTLLIFSCREMEVPIVTCDAVDYTQLSQNESDFVEVVFGSEFGEEVDRVRKWNKDILIYLPNAPDQVLQEILNEVIDEINFLSETISLRLVNSVERSNFILFFGSGEDYVKQWEPSAANLIASNRGLFSIDYNSSSYEIVSGNAWIDVTLVADYACLKHLLREEMTQSLGMINDIYSDQESIFYGNYRCFTDYTARDKVFIAEFMSEKIKPGQCISQVLERITID